MQLPRPCEDKNRWIHVFSGKRTKIQKRKFSEAILNIFITHYNSQGGKNDLRDLSY